MCTKHLTGHLRPISDAVPQQESTFVSLTMISPQPQLFLN